MEQLAALRRDLNIPPAGTSEGNEAATLSKLVIGKSDWFGISAHGQEVTLRVNIISESHAETDAFQQAANSGFHGDSGVLYIDQDMCQACGLRGATKSLAKQIGLKHLTVVMPSGVVDWNLLEP